MRFFCECPTGGLERTARYSPDELAVGSEGNQSRCVLGAHRTRTSPLLLSGRT